MSVERDTELELRRAVGNAQARLERVRVAVGDQRAIRAAEEIVLETRAAFRHFEETRSQAVATNRSALDDAKP